MSLERNNDKAFPVIFQIILIFIVLFITAAFPNISDGAEGDSAAQVIDDAKKEGKLVLYGSMDITHSMKMINGFKKKYPFIKTELVRAGSSKLLNKILAETKAKRYLVDVIQISGFQAYPLKKRNLFLQYVPNESRVYQKGFKDPDGHWTSLYLLPYVMGYNTRLLSPSDIPDTYEGFLDPKWKGKKIGFDTQEVEWFANMLEIMGKEKGLEFMRKFSAQNLAYRLGHTLIAQLVIAGEFPIATVYPQGVEEKKKLGAPIEWVGTKPVIVKLSAIGIYSHAPNPNAAKLYIDFSLSREGQMIIKSLGRVPARPDVEVEYKKKLEGISLYPSDLSMAEKYVEYYRQFKDIFKF